VPFRSSQQFIDSFDLPEHFGSAFRYLQSDNNIKCKVRHWPVQPKQQALRYGHGHGQAQRQIEDALDAQAELTRLVDGCLAAAALAALLAMSVHLWVTPDEQPVRIMSASMYLFQFVVWYF